MDFARALQLLQTPRLVRRAFIEGAPCLGRPELSLREQSDLVWRIGVITVEILPPRRFCNRRENLKLNPAFAQARKINMAADVAFGGIAPPKQAIRMQIRNP